VKLFNWLFTIYQGRLRFTSQVVWTLGFMVTFAIGGMTGVLLAIRVLTSCCTTACS
jgi:cytochrome o ubiquinol oxidase subunit 1